MTAVASGLASADLAIEGVEHAYDDDVVLRDIDLTIAAGECLTLLGPSGCGKTTLLRTIAGLERPQAGRIRIGGADVGSPSTWTPPERRRVGMVFQDWALFPHISVEGNVGYGLPKAQRRGPAVSDALKLVGLADLAERMPHTLSGGQQQRVALARALAPRPRILLLDEPFSNLDTAMRVEVRSEVHRLLHELEITSVFVTHDQEEAFVLGDRVAVMHEGRIRQVDTPQGVYHRPVDRWVAEFVGSVSVLTGMAGAGHAMTALGEIPVDAGLDGAVDVLLRPEHLAVVPHAERSDVPAGVVEFVEFYGHDAMVFVEQEGARYQVRTGPMTRVKRGDSVALQFVGDTATAFPATAD